MHEYVLDGIPVRFDTDGLKRRLRIEPNSAMADDFDQFVLDAEKLAMPRALYKIEGIEARGRETVTIDGVTFTSRVLSVNLSSLNRVFPYVATCGPEIEEWSQGLKDVLARFWGEALNTSALYAAIQALRADIDRRFRPGQLSSMTPGSLKDWPLREQQQIFRLLGDNASSTGVSLTEGYMMTPAKSVSGILFANDEGYENCELCPRKDCPGRRKPYSPGLYEQKYGTGN